MSDLEAVLREQNLYILTGHGPIRTVRVHRFYDIHTHIDQLIQRPRFKLPRSIVHVNPRSPVSEHLSLPDEHPGPRKDEQPNRADGVEHVRNPDSVHPGRHSEDKDSAKHIPQESERSQRVANDVCKLSSADEPQKIRPKEETTHRYKRLVNTSVPNSAAAQCRNCKFHTRQQCATSACHQPANSQNTTPRRTGTG